MMIEERIVEDYNIRINNIDKLIGNKNIIDVLKNSLIERDDKVYLEKKTKYLILDHKKIKEKVW